MTILGMDLGTTNSCVAVFRDGRPQILVNAEGQRTTPSVVTFGGDEQVLVGGPARRQAVMNPAATITAVKRLVGRRFDSEEVRSLRSISPYFIVRARNGDAWVQVGDRQYSPPEVQAHVLAKLRACAAADFGADVSRAVITVPAYFDEAQRQATRDAATIAGLDTARILNEPTAAALAYGVAQSSGHRLVVFDLGGGTFDVTTMMVEDGVFEVLSTTGDMMLGGEDFDLAVARKVSEEIRDEHGVDVWADPVAAQRLISEVEQAKRQLTELDSAQLGLPFLAMGPNGPINVSRTLTRAEFHQITAPLIQRLVEPCRRALADAKLTADKVDDVLLVGGMTRCHAVRDLATELFGQRPSLRINPDEAIALGAALEAAILQGDLGETVLVDVAPHTIGLRAAGDRFVPLISRGTPLPTRVRKMFSNARDNQTFVDIEIYQGDASVASKNRRLARVRMEGLPPGPKGTVRVVVTFAVDASGLLSVTAQIKATGKKTQVVVQADSGLTRPEVERLTLEHARRRQF